MQSNKRHRMTSGALALEVSKKTNVANSCCLAKRFVWLALVCPIEMSGVDIAFDS